MSDPNTEQNQSTTKKLMVYLPTRQSPLIFEDKAQIVIGRRDEKNNIFPDIDFTDYGGLSLGVSRKHAEIRKLDDLYYILDISSANGTWLNENSLVPFQPKALQSGDQIRVGQAVMSVRFAEPEEVVSIREEARKRSTVIRLSANTEYDLFAEMGMTLSRFGKTLSDYLQALEELNNLMAELSGEHPDEIYVRSVNAPISERTVILEFIGADNMFSFLKSALKTNGNSDEKSIKTRAITESMLEEQLEQQYEFKTTDTIDTIPEPAKVAEKLIKRASSEIDDSERIRYKAQLTRHLTTIFDYILIPTAIKLSE